MADFSWYGQWTSGITYNSNTFVKSLNICYVSTKTFYSVLPPDQDMDNWNVFVVGLSGMTPTPTVTITPTITPTNTITPTVTPTTPCYPQTGLELYVDASNPSSYPTTGSTWNNLVGLEDITLQNNPTFYSTDGGLIYFDSANSQYGTYPNLGQLTSFTVSVWYNMQNLPPAGAYYPALVSDSISSLNINYVIGSTNFGNNQLMAGGFHDGAWRVTTGFPIVANEWVYVTLTYDGTTLKLYKNDTLFSSSVIGVTAQTDGGVGYINRRWDNPDYYDVDISVVQIYGRELSLAEIQQNYNCFAGRYSVTPTPTPTSTITSTPTPTITNTPTVTQTPTEYPCVVTFSEEFTGGTLPSASIISSWNSFTSSLMGNYVEFTLSTSLGESITVYDPVSVQLIADSLRTQIATSQTIGSFTWYSQPCVGGWELSTISCNCGGNNYAIRPNITGNANWGGLNNDTCNQPTQILTLSFSCIQTLTPTPTTTQTNTPTVTQTPTITNTPTVTQTPTITITPTSTVTTTPTPTITNTPTVTQTPTITPNIVTNGLVIQLDAYTSSSYPGTGTTVYDITSGYNHTLTNAPYTVLSGVKCFDCNGLTTNIRVNSTGPTLPSSGYTYVSWVRIKNNSTTYRTLYRTAPNDHPVLVNISTNTLGFYDNDVASFVSSGYDVTPILDTWAQLTVVGTSTGCTFYINTTQVGSVSYNAAGNRHDYWGSINGQPFGYVANMYYYNKSLSLSEITQQYNFLSPRFV